MKKSFIYISFAVLVTAACSTSKKTTTSSSPVSVNSTNSVKSATAEVTPTVSVVKSMKSPDGVYEPGEEELLAIQPQYKDVTGTQLKEGYVLYAKSACVSCHGAVNIYTFPTFKWPMVLQDMAYRAKLTPEQKESVTRYVYAVLAANPNKK